MKIFHRIIMLPLAVISTVSCVAEPEEVDGSGEESNEDDLGSSQDAFTGLGSASVQSWGSYAENGFPITPGTRSALSGVYGNFSQPFPLNNIRAETFINSNNEFKVVAQAGVSRQIQADAYAIYPSSLLAAATCSHNGSGFVTVNFSATPSGNYHCFLTAVRNTLDDSWNSWDDKAEITYVNGIPKLTCYNDAQASAQCLSVTGYLGGASTGSTSETSNVDLGPVGTNGKVCLLTALNGTFRSDSLTQHSVRARIVNNSWLFTTTAGKGGSVACVY